MAKTKTEVEPVRTQHAMPDLGRVYEANVHFVWRTLVRLGVPSSAAEDVTQDVFLVVRRRLPDYDPQYPMRAWLFGIARRVAKDHRRSTTRAALRLELLPPSDAQPSPEQRASAQEAAELVHRFLATLDDDARELFVLCELEDLSGTEASAALGLNRNTLYSKRRKLRARFDKYVRRAHRPGLQRTSS